MCLFFFAQVLAEFENEPNAPKLGEKGFFALYEYVAAMCVLFPAEFLKDLFGEGKYANAVVVELLSDPEGSTTCTSASCTCT